MHLMLVCHAVCCASAKFSGLTDRVQLSRFLVAKSMLKGSPLRHNFLVLWFLFGLVVIYGRTVG